jgi:hypothetical protein
MAIKERYDRKRDNRSQRGPVEPGSPVMIRIHADSNCEKRSGQVVRN